MERKTVFVCANCSLKEFSNHLLYEQGWRYLKTIEWKETKEQENSVVEKHFCSKKCFINFIDSLSEKSIIELENDEDKENEAHFD